jgi:Reverse transcriptase (RNA-dependent DNA polymerase)
LKVKYNADGSLEHYKARLVAKGYSQHPVLNFKKTFAPTVRYATIHTILAIAALKDLELCSMDISHAYLNGELEEDIFMQQPERFKVGRAEYVCKLRKLLYGLKQADRVHSCLVSYHHHLFLMMASPAFATCKLSPPVFSLPNKKLKLTPPSPSNPGTNHPPPFGVEKANAPSVFDVLNIFCSQ